MLWNRNGLCPSESKEQSFISSWMSLSKLDYWRNLITALYALHTSEVWFWLAEAVPIALYSVCQIFCWSHSGQTCYPARPNVWQMISAVFFVRFSDHRCRWMAYVLWKWFWDLCIHLLTGLWDVKFKTPPPNHQNGPAITRMDQYFSLLGGYKSEHCFSKQCRQ